MFPQKLTRNIRSTLSHEIDLLARTERLGLRYGIGRIDLSMVEAKVREKITQKNNCPSPKALTESNSQVLI